MAGKCLNLVSFYNKESLVQRSSAVNDGPNFPRTFSGPILVYYCLVTEFETNVIPVVVANKEEEPQFLIYHMNTGSSTSPLPRPTAASYLFWQAQTHKRNYFGKGCVRLA